MPLLTQSTFEITKDMQIGGIKRQNKNTNKDNQRKGVCAAACMWVHTWMYVSRHESTAHIRFGGEVND